MELSGLLGAGVAAAVLLACTAYGLLSRRRDGLPHRQTASTGPTDAHAALFRRLGVREGVPVTLLQFSTPLCAPCRATRALCADLAATTAGVRHVEIDAAADVDAARTLDIRRAPTLLVIDADGRVLRRGSGQPTRGQVRAAIDQALARSSSRTGN